jgi:hypothetical protein
MMVSEVDRLAAARELLIAQREITAINVEIGKLMGRRSEQEKIGARARLTMDGIDPCRKCGRLVKSPCHDLDGYREAGPWDGSCRDQFEERA